jgi:hypothetical protein
MLAKGIFPALLGSSLRTLARWMLGSRQINLQNNLGVCHCDGSDAAESPDTIV